MTVQNPAIFTICSNNYVPMAQVLIRSARQHHPDATLYLCVADKLLTAPDFYPPDCVVIPADALDIPEFSEFAFRYDIMEFNTALKPFMFLELLKRGHDGILYFDPDIEIFAPLDGIVDRLDRGASFVLTPHLLRPAEGDSNPDDVGIMRAGIYNLGFLGVGATAEVPPIIEWWARRLRYQCVAEQEHGLFVDQKFVDLVPGFAECVAILRDSRYNVAYWNLGQRSLEQDGEGWRVDGEKLGFFHFSGFDCTNEDHLSKYTTAFRHGDIAPPLRAIIRHYASQVLMNSDSKASRIPYGYGQFASGAPILTQARRVFRRRYADWKGNPFTHFEALAPLAGASLAPQMSAEDLSRHVEAIYASASWRITKPLRALKQWLRA